jgi:RNA polymerase sigma-70 factor (ECF subfamily)
VEQDEDWQLIQRAIAALPVTQRVVVVLYYLGELSLQEISEILEVPVRTVNRYERNCIGFCRG